MDIQAIRRCAIHSQKLPTKNGSRVEVIPSCDEKTLSLIHQKGDEMRTSFADFLTFSPDGHAMYPIDAVAFRYEAERTGRITGLRFFLLGNNLHAPNFFHLSFITRISFCGHFSFITPAFKIISQLTVLTSVRFELNKSQQPFFLEKLEDDYSSVYPNHSVKTLEIFSDPGHTDVLLTEIILEVLFSRASVCLQSLSRLSLQLPLVPVAKNMFLRILRNALVNRCEQKIKFSLPEVDESPTLKCVYEATTKDPRYLPLTILTPWDSDIKNKLPQSFWNYCNGHAAKHLLDTIFGSFNPAQWKSAKETFVKWNESKSSQTSVGLAPPYLEVFCDFHLAHPFETLVKIRFAKNGATFESGMETLRDLGTAVSGLKYRHSQLITSSRVEEVKRKKARHQMMICKIARKVCTESCQHFGLHGVIDYPLYPVSAPLMH